ncbi:MAG: hypothetical protein JW966_09470 [Anaerolineae bacterium]|nr:hypothetical protein [Anaerolineae bacterium]
MNNVNNMNHINDIDDIDDDSLTKSNRIRSAKAKLRSRCPSCGSEVSLRDSVEIWDLVNCPSCNILLEVVDLRPPTLGYAQDEVDDDWEEEDWEKEPRRR